MATQHYALDIKKGWPGEQLSIINTYLASEQGDRDKIRFCDSIDIKDVQLLFSELTRTDDGPEQIGDREATSSTP